MPLSPQEIRRLLCRLLWRAVHPIDHVLHGQFGDVFTSGARNSPITDAVVLPRLLS